MRISVIIQARMGSSRLPGKTLMTIGGKPMLWHVIERLKGSKKIDDIIVATTTNPEDDAIEALAKEQAWLLYRGSSEDVLDRYYQAAKKFGIDVIVRITSDCPLIDPEIVDLIIEKHLSSGADYTSNVLKRTFPRGLDVEVFNFKTLEKAHKQAKKDLQREHVTLYIYEHPEIFHLDNIENNKNLSYMRWTVDEMKDLELVRKIYSKLYKGGKIFLLQDIVNLFKKSPELLEINKEVKQKEI